MQHVSAFASPTIHQHDQYDTNQGSVLADLTELGPEVPIDPGDSPYVVHCRIVTPCISCVCTLYEAAVVCSARTWQGCVAQCAHGK
jgi:hypothetical protein